MIIEFVGLPGSGKSSIVRLIAARNPDIRTVIVTKARWTDVVRRPLATARHLAAWGSLWWEWSEKQALVSLLRRRIRQDSFVEDPGSLVILEEGMTYHVWRDTVMFPALRDEPWEPLIRGEHPLIALGADDGTLHARIKGKARRGRVNEYLASLSISGPAWRRAADLYEDILAEAARHRPLLRIDTSGGLEDAADRVWNAIRIYDPEAGRFRRGVADEAY